MSKQQVINWKMHVEQLKTWDKPIAEYAKAHNLKKSRLYYWRDVLSKAQKPAKVTPHPSFVPIKLKPQEEFFSLKINKDNLIFELNSLSLNAVKELLNLKGGLS